ncbi:nudC domain-containing protein 1-like [Dreissena polymorpha]|uniref:nudC domain-containing protein 1-like n=1 Tax=Dreissena polymorpha TaxID=45954 RepID=UPI0022647C7E|nr:nudC domain-containing protein 1-like [Dreissena polymorpha]
MKASMELKPDRDLLNPNFEGYKLSLDKQPIYTSNLENVLYAVELQDDQFSYHHAKLLGNHNHLMVDPWVRDNVYLVDKLWNVRHSLTTDTSVSVSPPVYRIPDADDRQLVPSHYAVRVHFLSADLVVIGDGAGRVHIIETGDRQTGNDVPWKTLLTKTIPGEGTPSLLVDGVYWIENEAHRVECILSHVTEATAEQKDKYESQYLTMIEWATFTSVDRKSWCLERTRQLLSRKPFHYVALGREGQSITIAGEADFVFTIDSEQPVVSDEEKEVEKPVIKPPDYTWYQTDEDVNVQFTVPEGVSNKDIYMTLTFNHVEFGVKNRAPELLVGDLCGEVDVEGSTWTMEGRRVDLYLIKKSSGPWPLVVKGDTRGEMVLNPEDVASIHERLAHLTSDQWNPCPEKAGNRPFNTQQLEECDMYPDDDSTLVRLHGNTHKVTHKAGLGSHQWLFNVSGPLNSSPQICLRHDVDGLLWEQEQGSGDMQFKHTSTFNAFGYVQASKQQRKFSLCPPDRSYVVICDNSRHLYLYRQAFTVSTPLRNRKTGQEVKVVAKQQVVALDTNDNILGVVANNERIYVTTLNKLFMVKISS